MNNYMELKVKALSINESFVRTVVASFCLQLSPTIEELNDIKTAVSEAVTNSIVHAYPNKQGDVLIKANIVNDNTFIVEVCDDGVGINDYEKAKEPFYTSKPDCERSGMGFAVMESFMDKVTLSSNNGKGLKVTMEKKIVRQDSGDKWFLLEHEETLSLVKQAQQGSEEAKSLLLQHNYPLIKSVIKRFKDKGVEYDDLYQLGCVGFLKAIDNFNEEFNVKFSTYVVPMVAGEVKRYLRDDGSIKVSRSLKSLNYQINKLIKEHRNNNNDSTPTVDEIAKILNVEAGDVVLAMESCRALVSLNEKFDEDDDRSCSILEKVECEDNCHELIDYISLKQALKLLDGKEKKIIILRYFRNKTQSEVASEIGVSQVQVSRMENKILEKMRKQID